MHCHTECPLKQPLKPGTLPKIGKYANSTNKCCMTTLKELLYKGDGSFKERLFSSHVNFGITSCPCSEFMVCVCHRFTLKWLRNKSCFSHA